MRLFMENNFLFCRRIYERSKSSRRYNAFSAHSLVVLLLAVLATRRIIDIAAGAFPVSELQRMRRQAITAKVKTNLALDAKVSATDVHVKTYKGVVDLSGFVNSQSEISEAESVAGQVSGVKSVHNNLIVKGTVAPPTAAEKRAE